MKNGWKIKSLDEIAIIKGGKRVPKGYQFESEPTLHPYITVSDFTEDGTICTEKIKYISDEIYRQIKNYTISSLDIYVSIAGTIGKTGSVPYNLDGANLTENACKLVLQEGIEKKFIYYFTKTDNFIRQTGINTRVAAQPKLALIRLKTITLPVPPLSEQKRIVSIVDEAFEAIDIAIDNTKQNLTNARELFESYLNSRLFNVVSGKATQTLLCITNLIIDCEHKTAPIQEEGIPSIRTPNIGKGHLIFDGVYRVSEETYELWTRRGKPESGDLILAREAPAGNVGVVPPGAKVCLGQRTVLIRPNKKIIDSHYLAFLLLHPIMQKRLLDKSTGATVQHVNMKDIRGLSMSELPSIQVQKACVEELEHFKSEVNRLEKIYQGKLAALNELKQSILHKAFTGELTADTADLKTNIEQEAIAV
jgi:type I restriction enzyme, S subunit